MAGLQAWNEYLVAKGIQSDNVIQNTARILSGLNAEVSAALYFDEFVAIAGHTNIHTILMYANPSRNKILEKVNAL